MLSDSPTKRNHNPGVAVFRCLLMWLIVLHHSICHTKFGSDMRWLPVFLLTIPAVDGFLSISGWYGVRLKWGKVVDLAGQIAFYAVLFSGLSIILARMGIVEHPVVAVGNAWYGIAYLALLVLSPLLNAGLESLISGGMAKGFMGAFAVLFIVDWASRAVGLGFHVNGFGSHTCMTFIFVYCMVYLHRRVYGALSLRSAGCVGAVAFLLYLVAFFARAYCIGGGASVLQVVEKWGFYNCPLVIACAYSAFSIFLHLKVPAVLCRILTFLSPSIFAVYLIHDASPVMKQLWVYKPVYAFGPILGSICVFAFCLVIDIVVRRPWWGIVTRIASSSGAIGMGDPKDNG